MKKLFLLLFLAAPVFALAQENLMGQSRAQIKAHFKKEKIALYKTDNTGPNPSDDYKNEDGPDITCIFDKAGICGQELDIEQYSVLAKLKPILDRDWVKVDEKTWVDKAKTIRLLITPLQALDQVYIIYTKYGKDVSDPF
jgi:hypothetical protein